MMGAEYKNGCTLPAAKHTLLGIGIAITTIPRGYAAVFVIRDK
jgi:hypothetical protein